jgi:YVTN family beta-propeller protein
LVLLFALIAFGCSSAVASTMPYTAFVVTGSGSLGRSGAVTPIEVATNTPGPAIGEGGASPTAIAITPDGRTAYITNERGASVTPIELSTYALGPEINVGNEPVAIAITPDGTTAYVTNAGSGSVTPIDLATDMPGPEIKVGTAPEGIAISPDGKTAYVTNAGSGSVTPIELTTDTPGPEIKVGKAPDGIAITPDGRTAYVANAGSDSVTPIELATQTAGAEIQMCRDPVAVAITPDGKTAYVANALCGVTPIDVATNTPGPVITEECNPMGIAVSPDDKTAYVSGQGCRWVMPIEVATNKPEADIEVGQGPIGVAFTVAPLAAPAVVSGAASASTEPSVTLSAMVNPNGGLVSECSFEYGTSTSYGSTAPCMPRPGFAPGFVAVSATVSGLTANTEYHFRISATNEAGTSTSLDKTFETIPPEVILPPFVPTARPPAISAASLTNKRFRVARWATAISADKAPLGTDVRFTLSTVAAVQIAITHSVAGLRHGHTCTAPTVALKRSHAKDCIRTLTLGILTRSNEPQGADSVAFSGRIGHRPLSPAAYDAVVQASDAAGRSRPVTLSFRISDG